MELQTTTSFDLPTITRWLFTDSWHKDDPRHTPDFLLTPGGVLAFKIVDDQGTLCFVRLDKEGDVLRLATQFGPEEEVSKRRLITGLLGIGIPAIKSFAAGNNYKGIVFESVSPSLIAFMDKQGFKPVGGDDYQWTNEVKTDV